MTVQLILGTGLLLGNLRTRTGKNLLWKNVCFRSVTSLIPQLAHYAFFPTNYFGSSPIRNIDWFFARIIVPGRMSFREITRPNKIRRLNREFPKIVGNMIFLIEFFWRIWFIKAYANVLKLVDCLLRTGQNLEC